MSCIATLAGKEEEARERLSQSEASNNLSILETSVLYILSNWPEGFSANTPKEVLLIHEVSIHLIKYYIVSMLIMYLNICGMYCKCIREISYHGFHVVSLFDVVTL